MTPLIAIVLLVSQTATPIEPEHAKNAIYADLLAGALTIEGKPIPLPAPRLHDGQDIAAQKAALKEFAGGDRALDDLLRDSVTAPFVLKLRDEKLASGEAIRYADLVFAVRGDFAAIDPLQAARKTSGKSTEVANMRVETRVVGNDELPGKVSETSPTHQEWFTHLSARMLDRIAIESTDHVVVTRSKESMVVAARTDPRFATVPKLANQWFNLDRDGKPTGPIHPYLGGASYVKASRLADDSGTLIVEARFLFLEPKGWFDGAPILRSKFAPIAQDQIRRLRREVKSRKP